MYTGSVWQDLYAANSWQLSLIALLKKKYIYIIESTSAFLVFCFRTSHTDFSYPFS